MADWYVDQAGGGDGTAPNSAWSRSEADTNQASVAAGDTVWLLDAQTGTWQSIAFANGAAGAPITIRGDFPGRPFSLTYSGAVGVNQVMHFDTLDYLTVKSITTAGPQAEGILFADCSNLDVTDLYSSGQDVAGVVFRRCNNVTAHGTIEGHDCYDRGGSGIGRGVGINATSGTSDNIDFSDAHVKASGNGRRGLTISGDSTWVGGAPTLSNVVMGQVTCWDNGSGIDVDNVINCHNTGAWLCYDNNVTGKDSGSLDEHRALALTECVNVRIYNLTGHGHPKEAVRVTGVLNQEVANTYLIGALLYNNDIAETANYEIYVDTTYVDSFYLYANRISARARHVRMVEVNTQCLVAHNIFSGGDTGLRTVGDSSNWGIHDNIFDGITEPFGGSGTTHTSPHTGNLYVGYTQFDYNSVVEADRATFEATSVEFDPLLDATDLLPDLDSLSAANKTTLTTEGLKWWTGGPPIDHTRNPYPSINISIGPIQALTDPLHPLNLVR